MTDWKEDGKNSDGKADVGKTMMSLALVQFGDLNYKIAEVLTFGAVKYPKAITHDSWKDVPEGRRRYLDAALRHFHKYFIEGEVLDPESKQPHMAHMMTNFHFVYELDKIEARSTHSTETPPALTSACGNPLSR